MIKRVDHIGIAVRNIEEVLNFYRQCLGLELAHTEVEPDHRVVVAFLPAGESEVELLEPIDPDSAVGRFLQKRGEGIHHICFEVKDLRQALARLKEQGVSLIDEEPRLGTGGKRIAFLHPKGAHGVLIELYERVPGEKKPPLVDLDALRERLLVESQVAQAGLRGFLTALQRGGRRPVGKTSPAGDGPESSTKLSEVSTSTAEPVAKGAPARKKAGRSRGKRAARAVARRKVGLSPKARSKKSKR